VDATEHIKIRQIILDLPSVRLIFLSSIGPSRQRSSRRKDKSTDGVGLLGEDTGNWNQSEIWQLSSLKGL